MIENKQKIKIPTEFKEKIKDRWWRLNHLYKIRDTSGNLIVFKPNEAQVKLYNNLHTRNIIPKARQLGFSTFSVILFLDGVLFSSQKKAAIVTKDEDSAKELFRDKLLLAIQHLPIWLKVMIKDLDNKTQKMITLKNGSSFMISNSTRSGTVNFLHISELGVIDKAAPLKAAEIISGSLNTTHTNFDSENIIIIESTAMGKGGEFHRLSILARDRALEIVDNLAEGKNDYLAADEYKLHFVPWWTDKKHFVENKHIEVSNETQVYFKGLEAELKNTFSEGQKRWWQLKKKEQGDKMPYEHPSTFSEAFSSKAVGVIYQDEMKQLFEDNRYRPLPYNTEYYVDTWWDLGVSDLCVILFTQTIDSMIYLIDVHVENGKGMDHYAKVLEERKYRYNRHHLPWDGSKRDVGSAKTPKQLLLSYGVTGIKIAPQISIADGINNVRSIFRRLIINELKCHSVKESLLTYRWKFNKTLGEFTGVPVHDKHSHIADPFRVTGALWRDGNNRVTLDADNTTDANLQDSQNVYDNF